MQINAADTFQFSAINAQSSSLDLFIQVVTTPRQPPPPPTSVIRVLYRSIGAGDDVLELFQQPVVPDRLFQGVSSITAGDRICSRWPAIFRRTHCLSSGPTPPRPATWHIMSWRFIPTRTESKKRLDPAQIAGIVLLVQHPRHRHKRQAIRNSNAVLVAGARAQSERWLLVKGTTQLTGNRAQCYRGPAAGERAGGHLDFNGHRSPGATPSLRRPRQQSKAGRRASQLPAASDPISMTKAVQHRFRR